MKMLALPRDPNPYQNLLYSEIEHLGLKVIYIGDLTPSHTLNLLLLPFEMLARRIAGARVVHLHWVFAFNFPGAQRFSCVRWLSYFWFIGWLRTCQALRMRLVWTAHNVLPHKQVFPNDISARRALTRACGLVIAHSQTTFTELAALGCTVQNQAIIPHGPVAPKRCAHLRVPGTGTEHRKFLFLGRILEYKGVEDLLTAFGTILNETKATLAVVGQCDDPALRSLLGSLAPKDTKRVSLRLEWVAEEELTDLLAAADILVLPFRKVTTSGSAMLALSHGRPLVIPNLAALTNIPEQAVFRYENGVPGLTKALKQAAQVDSQTLATMSNAALTYSSDTTWREIAKKTVDEMTASWGGSPKQQG
jgi:glycosyltransferase involved in cell wall biosynthesis